MAVLVLAVLLMLMLQPKSADCGDDSAAGVGCAADAAAFVCV